MVLPVLRPMTIAAATGLIAGAFTSCTIVYADEYDHHQNEHDGHDRGRRYYDNNDSDHKEDGHSYPSFDRRYHRHHQHQSSPNSHGGYHRVYLNHPQSKLEREEDLVPGLVYVALAGISGSVIARQRNVMIRIASPLAFATAAGAYFLPNTTHALLDPVIGGGNPASSKSTKETASASTPMTSELTSRARQAWHQAEPRSQDLRERRHERGTLGRVEDAYITSPREVDESLNRARNNTQPEAQPIEHSGDKSFSWFGLSKPTKAADSLDNAGQELKTQAKEAQYGWDRRSDEVGDKLKEKAKEAQTPRVDTVSLDQAKDQLKEKAAETRDGVKEWWGRQSSNMEDKAKELESEVKGLEPKVKEASQEAKHWWSSKSSEAGEKAEKLEEKATEATQQAKHWWNRTSANVGEKVNELEDQAKETTKDAKHWWDKRSTEADQKLGELKEKAKDVSQQAGETLNDLKDKSKDVKSWVETKAHDAGKVAENVSAKASDTAQKTKDWVDDKQALVDQKLEASVQDADAWWKAQAEEEATKEKERLAKEKKETEKQWWFQRRSAKNAGGKDTGSAHVSPLGSTPSTYISSDSFMDGLLDSKDTADHWTSEMGSAKVRPLDTTPSTYISSDSFMDGLLDNKDTSDHGTSGNPTIKVGGKDVRSAQVRPLDTAPSTYISSDSFMDGLLDNKDISDHWTNEQTRQNLDTKDQQQLWDRDVDLLNRPREPEYWSNGEEMGTANVRDANYYNYSGGFAGTSLGRTSWWSRRVSDSEQAVSSLKDKAESLVWETKVAAERAAIEVADQLAHEQAVLERSAAEARARAEEAARKAQVQSDLLLRERQAAVERAAKEMEARLAAEKEATDRAAAEVKAKAEAWEDEQRSLAEQAAKAVEDRVAHEKRAADLTAQRLKARAEAWAREQKEQAELDAKEIHNRVQRETAAAEKNAREAKAALEARRKAEKFEAERMARELQDRIELQKIKEEVAQEELRTRAEANKRAAEEETKSTTSGWSWPWSSNKATPKEEESVKETTPTERRSWWSSGSKSTTTPSNNATELGHNVKAAAVKAEQDVKARAAQQGKNMNDTAKKAYDNVVDAASTVDSQLSASHAAIHGHEHGTGSDKSGDNEGYHFIDQVREDVLQTKDDIEHGVEKLKEAVFGAEQTAQKAADEGKKWWSSKTEQVDSQMKKAGDKLSEMGREAEDSEAEFWLKTEQRRQQNERRESGRAM
ncbi:hypothetical protein BGX31_005091 [Mortierella sp. GBA43]|nr:hypothetical protein BGX31_005091 [Mortierella sp. GBA43]